MSAKTYLNRARALKMSIKALERKRQEFEALKTAISSPMRDSDPVQTSKSGDAKYVRTIEKIAETEEILSIRIGEYSDLLDQMAEEIRQLKNPVYSEVLVRRYLDFQSFEKISYEMNYSYGYTRNLHQRALRTFAEAFPERC